MSEGLVVDSSLLDSRTLCPTSGQVCQAAANYVKLFSEEVTTDQAMHLPPELHPALNRLKLNGRLAELSTQAVLRNCGGGEEGICPTRKAMDESQIRQTAVRGIRRLIHRNK